MARFKTALVAGASGSGKTLIARMFQKAFVHSMDDYFNPPFDVNDDGIPKWDEPKAVNFDRWIKDYHKVKEAIDLRKTISLPRYDFVNGTPSEKQFDGKQWQSIHWIVLEGIFALDQRLHHLADIKVFVEAPFAVRVARKLGRDVAERAFDLKAERAFDLKKVLLHSYHAEQSYCKYILPQKEYADLVIPNYSLSSEELTNYQII